MACCYPEGCARDDCVQLTHREASVCVAICTSREPVSFSQLRLAVDLHQEILSRIVRRLTIHGLVAKVGGKYRGKCGEELGYQKAHEAKGPAGA